LGKSGISAKAAEHQVTTNLDGKNAVGPEDRRNFAMALSASHAAQTGAAAHPEGLLVQG
jgi:hypothetical protein